MRTPRPGPISSTTSLGAELGEPADHAEDVLVDEEVLAELASSARDAHGRPKAAVAFASICARELVRVLAARRRRARRACARRTPARSGGRARAAARGTGSRSRRGCRSAGTCARGVAQLVRVRVGDVAGERDVPAALERRSGAAPATRSSAARPCRRSAASSAERVVVGGARVDDDRQLAELGCELELRLEEPPLRVARRVVAVVVEAGLADGDDASDARAARELGERRRRVAGLVRVDAERRRRRRRARSASSSARLAPTRSSVPTVTIRVDAGFARARGHGCRRSSSASRCACVSITPASSTAELVVDDPGIELPEERLGLAKLLPGGSSLGCQRPDPARVVARQNRRASPGVLLDLAKLERPGEPALVPEQFVQLLARERQERREKHLERSTTRSAT